jgi:dipeptidyl aminopeptidase/acylaminoacyl peptidase
MRISSARPVMRFPATRRWSAALAAAATVFVATVPLAAQDGGYRLPPDPIPQILDAPPLPIVGVSPDRAYLLFSDRTSMPSIAELAEPMLRLAGTRINPATYGPASVPRTAGLRVKHVESGREHPIRTPADGAIVGSTFSPDGSRISFTHMRDDRLEVWVADVATGEARRVTDARLNGIGGACQWMPDSERMLCTLVPAGHGTPPAEPRVPSGPVIQESSGRSAPVRTYQDLLGNPHDEALYEHYFTAQLAIVDVTSGATTPVGRPAIFAGASPSPNGEYVLVTRVVRPFSYIVPQNFFPREQEVWNLRGEVVHRVASTPLQEGLRPGWVATGPRNVSWRAQQPATLVWVEALDGGDPNQPAEHRDRALSIAAPFSGEPREIARTEQRFAGIQWLEDGRGLITDFERAARNRRTFLFHPDQPQTEWRLVWHLNTEDAYADPGSPVMRRDDGGFVVAQHGDDIFLAGAGASPEGDRPFLDRLNLRTLRSERVWQSDADAYESFAALVDADGRRIITRHETATQPPNYMLRDTRSNQRTALTDFQDPAPQMRAVTKQLVVYEREDGVPLNGTLYLPADHQPGQRLPVVIWAYPREYVSADVAGQVRGSDTRFTNVGGSSHLFFLTQGYAVFDGPSMPIIGGDTANNRYVEQLVMSARAAVDKLVEMGVADRDRIGVGGHSYGGFMTANLLAHSRLFRAGIARSGAYNRTLTPFGFQAEQRTFWEAPDVYAAMSPFFHADKIQDPILFIHGDADNNSGTFPIQSERMYAAVIGHGGTARLVMLPHESHGYVARESVMHALAEMIEWFDRYVKNAQRRTADDS